VTEVEARKGTLAAKIGQAKAGGGAESLGARGGPSAFDEFRRMEDQIEAVETTVQAQRELDEVMGGSRGPGGMTREEVESKFRALESGQAPAPGAPARPDVEDELKALKKRVRVE
jgi:phage shock protein A